MAMERHEITNYLGSNITIPSPSPPALSQMIHQARINLRTSQMAQACCKRNFDSASLDLKAAEDHLHTLRSLRAPINRLPPEILSLLFLHCLPSTENATMNPEKAPLLLGRVCKRWRKIVYEHRPLWASLHIVIPERSKPIYDTNYRYPKRDRERFESQSRERYRKLLERFVDFVLAWIQRSGSSPLSLSLSMTYAIKRWPTDNPSFKTLNDGILSVCSRWSHVEFHLLEGDLSTTLASLLPSQVPFLKSLKIHFIGSSSAHDPTLWNTSTLFKAPNLSTLSLTGPPSKTQNTLINWNQLTSISICERGVLSPGLGTGVLSVSEAYDLLLNCTRLIQCTLHIYDSRTTQPQLDNDNETAEKIINLPHLQSLSIIDGSPSLKSLLKHLKTPSLSSLSFHRMHVPPSDLRTCEHSPLHTLILLSNNSLTHLTIDTQFTYSSEITSCFQNLPSLTHFRSAECLLGVSLTQTRSRNNSKDQIHSIISRLSQFPSLSSLHKPTWPNLTSLILHSGRNFTDTNIQTLIQNRFAAHQRHGSALLTHVDVIPGQFLPSEGFSMDTVMAKYKAKGATLRFSLKYLPQPKEEVRIDPEQGLAGGGGRG